MAASTMPPSELFPALEPFTHEWLAVGNGHEIYIEQCGRPNGIPVLFLHGGPASGCSPQHRRLFDPSLWRVVLIDQRGSGRSRPRGSVSGNTTAHLVRDLEAVRGHLGIAQWLVFGGSWGASLAMAYAAAHRHACLGVLLRGVFLTGSPDLDWFFSDARQLQPQAHARLRSFAGLSDTASAAEISAWYLNAVMSSDVHQAWPAVRQWMRWESALTQAGIPPFDDDSEALGMPDLALIDKYRLQAHYLSNECFMGEAVAIAHAQRLSGLPCMILHGQLDMVCRPINGWRVHQACQGSQLRWVSQVGHSLFEPAMVKAVVGALRHFAIEGAGY